MFDMADQNGTESLSKNEMKKSSLSEGRSALKSLFDPHNRGWLGLWLHLDTNNKNKDAKFSKQEFIDAYVDKAPLGVPDEAETEVLDNPARVTIPQREFISFETDSRYSPVVSNSRLRGSGIVMLDDSTPDEEQEIVVPEASSGLPEDEGEEPEPPPPFDYAEYM